MKIWLVVPALAIADCSSTSDQELEAVKSARSVLVEWALVESESARHDTTQAYANSMRAEARSQLRSAQGELKNRPAAAKLIAKVLAEPVDAPSLRAVAIRLLPLETQLEGS